MKKRIVMIAGWAHPGISLQPVADHLGKEFNVSLHAATDIIPLDEPSILLGWSLGGMQAIELAANVPDLVKGLVLIGTTPRFTVTPGAEFGTPEANLLDLMRQLKEDIKTTLQGFAAYAALPHRPTVRDMIHHLESLQEGLRYLRDKDLRPEIPKLKCPALLLHGRQDAVIPHTASEWLLKNLRNGKLVSADNMGHDLPLRRPDWVARHVREFCT